MANKLQFEIEVDASTGLLKIKQVAQSHDDLTESMNKQGRAAKSLTSEWDKAIKAAAGYFAFSTIKSQIAGWVSEAGRGQEALAGMTQAMRSMGRYTPELQGTLLNTAKSLQELTTFEDDAIVEGQKFLLTYKDITDDLLPRTSKTMADLAALMGGDTVQAANMLGKASMGMTGELRRVGITVDDATFKSKGFVGVLTEIEKQVGGQAEALANTGIGPWKQLANIWGDSKEALGELVLSISTGMIPTLKELSSVVREAAEYWQKMFTPPDEKGALENQRIKIAEQIEAEQRLLNYLKNTPAGRISAGPDGVAQVEARIAALNKSMQLVSRSLINLEAKKPAGGGSTGKGGGGQIYDDEWLKDYLKNVDAAWKREVERNEAIGELVNVETQWKEDALKKEEKDREEWLQNYLDGVDKAWDAEVKRSQGLGELAIVNQKIRDDELKKMDEVSKSMIKLSERTAEAMEQNFSDLFFDVMTGQFNSLADYATAVLQSIQRAISDYLGQVTRELMFGKDNSGGWVKSAMSAVGMAESAYFGGGGGGQSAVTSGYDSAATYNSEYLHAGGVVGYGGPKVRVPAALFRNAPRLHGGLMSDEYPAILQRGERVYPRGGGPVTNITIISDNGGEVATSRSKNETGGEDIVVKFEQKIAGNVASGRGPLFQVLRSTFGTAPVVGGR
jgi:hypothetical protein